MNKYKLVEFLEDGNRQVAVVPNNWLADGNLCWWPKSSSSSASWAINCRVPDATHGNYFPYTKVLGESDSYERLKKSEDKALDHSDVPGTETEEEADISRKRKSMMPSRFRSQSPEQSSSQPTNNSGSHISVSRNMSNITIRSRTRSRSRSVRSRSLRRQNSSSRNRSRSLRRQNSSSRNRSRSRSVRGQSRPRRNRSRSVERECRSSRNRSRSVRRRSRSNINSSRSVRRRSRSSSYRSLSMDRSQGGKASQSPPPKRMQILANQPRRVLPSRQDSERALDTHALLTTLIDKVNKLSVRFTRLEEEIIKNRQSSGTAAVVLDKQLPPALPPRDYPMVDRNTLSSFDEELMDNTTQDRAVL